MAEAKHTALAVYIADCLSGGLSADDIADALLTDLTSPLRPVVNAHDEPLRDRADADFIV